MEQKWIAFFGQMAAPFFLLACLLVALPIKRAIHLYMQDGRLKRLLLRRIDGKSRPGGAGK